MARKFGLKRPGEFGARRGLLPPPPSLEEAGCGSQASWAGHNRAGSGPPEPALHREPGCRRVGCLRRPFSWGSWRRRSLPGRSSRGRPKLLPSFASREGGRDPNLCGRLGQEVPDDTPHPIDVCRSAELPHKACPTQAVAPSRARLAAAVTPTRPPKGRCEICPTAPSVQPRPTTRRPVS